MGKVGSTTIWNSLKLSNIDAAIYHVHRINRDAVDRQLKQSKERFSALHIIYPETVHAEYWRAQLDKTHPKGHWKVITLVRDPIARTLSTFFQSLEDKTIAREGFYGSWNSQSYDELLDHLLEKFDSRYVQNSGKKHPYTWFEYEFKANLGCDLFSEPNICDKPYHICTTPKADVLLLKLERLNDHYKTAFREFLGIKNFDLRSKKIRSHEVYGDLYQDFLRYVELPDEYLDRIYSSPLVKNFYSDSEIEEFYRHWQRQSKSVL
jgi:hypothetical protein